MTKKDYKTLQIEKELYAKFRVLKKRGNFDFDSQFFKELLNMYMFYGGINEMEIIEEVEICLKNL